jgi:transposase
VVERWILARLRNRTFFSLADLNQAIREFLDQINARLMKHLGRSRRELFEMLDQPALKPLPESPYEFALWKKARVNIDYHVEFEKHYYSVPYKLVREKVYIRAAESTIEIFFKNRRVASHRRVNSPGRHTTVTEHMQAYRSCMGILQLAKRYGEERLEAACRRALPAGIHSYKGVKNILDAKLDQVEPEELATAVPTDHENIRGQTYYH